MKLLQKTEKTETVKERTREEGQGGSFGEVGMVVEREASKEIC